MNAKPATGEALPKIPPSNQHTGNEPIDELDFALDILRVTRVALLSPDMGGFSDHDMQSAAHCLSYALDALNVIRPFVNPIDGKTRQ